MSATARRLLSLGAAAFVLAGLPAASSGAGGSAPADSVLGTGRGLDHVIVVVRDLDTATRDFQDVLGFTAVPGAKLPGGVQSRALRLASTYIELMSVDTLQAPADDELVRLLKEREGGYAFALNVSSAQRTADALRARRFDVMGPAATPVSSDSSHETRTAPWQTVAIASPVLPFEPLFFIQYLPRGAKPVPPEPPNTAVDVRAVWIAVQDLEAATRGYEALGLQPGRTRRVPQLGARGREIRAGRGAILLLQANDASGPVAGYLARHGEGVVGLSIAVRDLRAARARLRTATGRDFALYKGHHGPSILVPPALTHGVWMEFCRR